VTDPSPYLADLDHLLAQLRRDASAAVAVMEGHARTGWRSSSRGGGGGASSVLDDEGVPMPPLADPVGEQAVAGTAPHGDLRQLVANLRGATNLLQSSLGIVHRHTPPATARPEDTDPGCRSCARLGTWVPRQRGDLCRWCDDFAAVENVDLPPLELARAHAEGRRITTAMVREHLAARQQRSPKRAARR
jgi:hypothetical protein